MSKAAAAETTFIVTLDFIWRFATTVLVVGGW